MCSIRTRSAAFGPIAYLITDNNVNATSHTNTQEKSIIV